jgi:peptidoglycan-associated lipoprotein
MSNPGRNKDMAKYRTHYLLAALLLGLAGCTGGQNHNGAAATGADNDSVNGIPLPPRQEGVSFLDPSVQKGRFAPVHFAFDSSSVSPDDAGKVQAVADFLKSAPNSVIIAGFTDERGTPGYNRALGEKRAGAVREALIHAGVSPARIQTVSFGAEMPVDPASNENAWAANRRAEFGITRQ